MSSKSLSIQDSNVLKGVALILLLWHHLFYVDNGMFSDINVWGDGLTNQIGQLRKVCVALFVFLSGYGLVVSTDSSNFRLRLFYVKRYTKLYLNYWLIWLLFVPINILCFDRTFTAVYQSYVIPKFLIDFCGLSCMFGTQTMNPTWWFYSCIVILYALFPIILSCLEKTKWIVTWLVVSLVIVFIPNLYLLEPVKYYLFPFLLGCVFGKGSIFNILPPQYVGPVNIFKRMYNRLIKICKGYGNTMDFVILIFVLVVSVVWRNSSTHNLFIDSWLTLLIYVIYLNMNISQNAKKIMQILGKHSFNIFLFHTFIYYYWFRNLLYSLNNPILIFLTLLVVTLVISVGMELVKNYIGYYKLQTRIINKFA